MNNYNYVFKTIQASNFSSDFRSVDPLVDTKCVSVQRARIHSSGCAAALVCSLWE